MASIALTAAAGCAGFVDGSKLARVLGGLATVGLAVSLCWWVVERRNR